jgi:predicted Kef-type K+ transport protein
MDGARHIAVGWLIVEDLAMVLALVFCPRSRNLSIEGESRPTADALFELVIPHHHRQAHCSSGSCWWSAAASFRRCQ